MVMGGVFTLICCKNCIVCLKKTEINEKEAGFGPFFLKQIGVYSVIASCRVNEKKPFYSSASAHCLIGRQLSLRGKQKSFIQLDNFQATDMARLSHHLTDKNECTNFN